MATTTRRWEGNKGLSRSLAPIEDLRPHPKNPRRGDVPAIVASLERFGQQRPILTLPDGTIVAGHHVYYAAIELGWTHVATVRSDLTEREVEAYLLADNRTAEMGSTDPEMLYAILKTYDTVEDLAGTGYTVDDLDYLAAEIRRGMQEQIDRGRATAVPLPTVRVKQVVLTLGEAQFERFSAMVKVLQKEYAREGVTEVVYEALERQIALVMA